jgi:hypothetical protein
MKIVKDKADAEQERAEEEARYKKLANEKRLR